MVALSLLTQDPILSWLLLAGLFGWSAMGLDKGLAAARGSRISEKTLWIIALVGGVWGIIVGAYTFHHKTRKLSFWGPVLLAALVWSLLPLAILTGLRL